MSNILIILGNTKTKSFNKALADSYEKGAKLGKHQVKRINIGELKFDPVLWEGYDSEQKLESDLVKVQKDILWADHIVFIYPTWWSSMPGILKGFLDRIFLSGFAFKFHEDKMLPEQLLKGKSARIIVTMDSPVLIYELVFGAPGNKIIKRGVLNFSGVHPVKITRFCSIRKSSEKTRTNWLKKTEKLGFKGK